MSRCKNNKSWPCIIFHSFFFLHSCQSRSHSFVLSPAFISTKHNIHNINILCHFLIQLFHHAYHRGSDALVGVDVVFCDGELDYLSLLFLLPCNHLFLVRLLLSLTDHLGTSNVSALNNLFVHSFTFMDEFLFIYFHQ